MRIVAVITILLGLFLASCSREERKEWETVQRDNTTTYSLSYGDDDTRGGRCSITVQEARITIHVLYAGDIPSRSFLLITQKNQVSYSETFIMAEDRSAKLSEGGWQWSEPALVVYALGLRTTPKPATSWLDTLWDRSLWGTHCKEYTTSLPEDVRSIVNY